VKNGQKILLKVAALPNQSFEGRITQIGTSVQGETRVVPVQAEINNLNGSLKPGMFADLEVITNRTAASILAIPTSAIVDANGKKVVYVQNGKAFQAADVTFGRTTGDLVEVKTGLFSGDMVVTQRGTQLYAQSLRGGSEKPEAEGGDKHEEEAPAKGNNAGFPWLFGLGGGSVLAIGTFAAGSFWGSRKRSGFLGADEVDIDELQGEIEGDPDDLYRLLPASDPSVAEVHSNNHDIPCVENRDGRTE
jgi:membrane fusion protein, heavy metal efflux system